MDYNKSQLHELIIYCLFQSQANLIKDDIDPKYFDGTKYLIGNKLIIFNPYFNKYKYIIFEEFVKIQIFDKPIHISYDSLLTKYNEIFVNINKNVITTTDIIKNFYYYSKNVIFFELTVMYDNVNNKWILKINYFDVLR